MLGKAEARRCVEVDANGALDARMLRRHVIKAPVSMIFYFQFHPCLSWCCCLLCCWLRLTSSSPAAFAWMYHAPEHEYVSCFEMIGALNKFKNCLAS